jgi:hypothetical protein
MFLVFWESAFGKFESAEHLLLLFVLPELLDLVALTQARSFHHVLELSFVVVALRSRVGGRYTLQEIVESVVVFVFEPSLPVHLLHFLLEQIIRILIDLLLIA